MFLGDTVRDGWFHHVMPAYLGNHTMLQIKPDLGTEGLTNLQKAKGLQWFISSGSLSYNIHQYPASKREAGVGLMRAEERKLGGETHTSFIVEVHRSKVLLNRVHWLKFRFQYRLFLFNESKKSQTTLKELEAFEWMTSPKKPTKVRDDLISWGLFRRHDKGFVLY